MPYWIGKYSGGTRPFWNAGKKSTTKPAPDGHRRIPRTTMWREWKNFWTNTRRFKSFLCNVQRTPRFPLSPITNIPRLTIRKRPRRRETCVPGKHNSQMYNRNDNTKINRILTESGTNVLILTQRFMRTNRARIRRNYLNTLPTKDKIEPDAEQENVQIIIYDPGLLVQTHESWRNREQYLLRKNG